MKYPDFGSNLRKARKHKDLTQAELGAHLDITSAKISTWESGDNLPALHSALKLSRAVGVDIYHLTGEKSPEVSIESTRNEIIIREDKEKDDKIGLLEKLIASHESTIESQQLTIKLLTGTKKG